MRIEKRRQHTVPRFYLRAWASNGQLDTISKATGRVFAQSVGNASVEHYFYAPEEISSHDNPQFMEENLARFEASVADAVKRGIAGAEWPLNQPDRASLADFISMMMVRSPNMRGQIEQRGSLVKGVDLDSEKDSGLLNALLVARGGIGADHSQSSTPAYTHVTEMAQLFLSLRPTIARAEWLRLDFDEPVLVTSDSPVSLVTGFRWPNWFRGEPVSVILIPLAPTCALALRLLDEDSGDFKILDPRQAGSAEDSSLINAFTLRSAERWGYKHPFGNVTVAQSDGGTPSVVSLSAQGPLAAEALLRWLHRTGSASAAEITRFLAEAVDYGLQMKGERNVAEARAAFVQAMVADDPEIAGAAAFNLGVLEGELGNADVARSAYQRALASDEFGAVVPAAGFMLGLLEDDQGNVAAARDAYQRAIHAGHPDLSPLAAFNLGGLERRTGDSDAALHALSLAAQSRDTDIAEAARTALAELQD